MNWAIPGRDTPKTSVLAKFKVISLGPFSGFVGHARYTNLPLFPPVRHFCFVPFVWLCSKVSHIAKDPDKIAPLGSVWSGFIVIASTIMIKASLNYTWMSAADVKSKQHLGQNNLAKMGLTHCMVGKFSYFCFRLPTFSKLT